ncbi:nitric oxide dioxygenase [Bradyrhizobium japonicum]|uniref:NO-inducible flavohemoprotein n=1 Tax=Bradyrhizobium japonicum TaxID=375 RepID=UPI002167128E|nr:NO-inducible flavohemoprotein [Bradyrhizobium japonicum]MCS3502242.1 nitric oxide dioxygenase [Bradyrhizobium japonicum]MCS3965044.1 nitric oxide dioxygenase [Bradyrhizobium japonicum]MCS3997351.1 nitric oxide dioxygenase [Bradyrhizobium japonicum]
MTEPLSAQTIAIVKATVPVLAEHGSTITTTMYRRLFEDEHIRALFNHSNQGEGGAQVHALAAAILGYAQNIDNLGALAPTVERIAHKHVGYHILPEHYPYVATALLGAIKEVLGDAASEDVLTAWGEAYWFLADILKGRETAIRERIEAVTGGWTGWRTFEVVEKRRESAVITSFILRPKDGGPILRHKPGQYLTFRLDAPGVSPMKRNYSISCAPNDDHYRISVKREASGQGGSRHLHDQVRVGDLLEVTPPAGDFYLDAEPQRPVVLLSGGVGLTPMVSIVETIAAQHPGLETHFVHGTLNSDTHALNEHVRTLAKRHGAISVSTFYNEPGPRDVVGTTHDVTGIITVDWLKTNAPLLEADIFLCGPKPFLRALVSGLSLAGVAADRIHYEFFGPADEMLAA